MQEELLKIKKAVIELHSQTQDLSTGLWELALQVDDFLRKDLYLSRQKPSSDEEAVELAHSEPETHTPQAEQPVRVKGRPKREPIPEPPAPPEPPEPPRRHDFIKEVRKPAIEPEVMPQATEPPKKRGIVEQLLGKDASDKAKLRAERLAQLEKELADLKKK